VSAPEAVGIQVALQRSATFSSTVIAEIWNERHDAAARCLGRFVGDVDN
jgi:hypothetical protein